jgi:hypothetical protein
MLSIALLQASVNWFVHKKVTKSRGIPDVCLGFLLCSTEKLVLRCVPQFCVAIYSPNWARVILGYAGV